MSDIDKKSLSERDICTKFITPALVAHAGWNLYSQIREEVTFTAGRVLVRGKLTSRGETKRADYILYYQPNLPIAVIEAKDNNYSVGAGMQQALGYAEILDIPFVYSSNGDAFLEHDRTRSDRDIEREIPLEQFPTPDELWRRYRAWKGFNERQNEIITQEYYSDGSEKKPRYYQLIAINRTIEEIARGKKRILLVMSTGTGKTYTAFQIIWRLWKSRTCKRILFLADRNILVDQTRTNDFKPFGQAMTKIKKRQVDKSYEIYLSLYQAVSGNEEAKNIYKQFSPDFFDLVIVDECHRGSAAQDSAWREILEYFAGAAQIGLTATPKETKDVSNIDYFGQPIYTYSLKQGIEDGFLAPYKVIRVDIDRDVLGWQPTPGQLDKYGQLIDDRIYNQRDMNRSLVLEARDILVAEKITEFLKATDRFAKTIVFCEDIDHAERMRSALTRANADLASQNRRYVVRITGDEKEELDNFILPEEPYPVIATTSKLLTTGVDAQTCQLIVLDQSIQSMTEFKQIIGRGTRINEAYNKKYFTIMDFKRATELFADPNFDGDPVQVYSPQSNEPIVLSEELTDEPTPDDNSVNIDRPDSNETGRIKYYVTKDAVTVSTLRVRVQYYDREGKLITESLKDYTKKRVNEEFSSLNAFLRRWSEADLKQAILDELQEKGVNFEALEAEVGKNYDAFDLICHVAFDQPPLSRSERANRVRKRNYFTQYGEKARAVLDALLDKYADEGIECIEDRAVLTIPPLNQLATPIEILKSFGGEQKYLDAVRQLKSQLYQAS
ncbi:MAG: hypothetical protein N5P05_004543 (plasmid) [Chroococcopsis gigantea SAG 12.99]|jgi:type I restriction enzyme R subunit|nr:hypothetical protein [Chroococcopsis gigantea SAG 12.99]